MSIAEGRGPCSGFFACPEVTGYIKSRFRNQTLGFRVPCFGSFAKCLGCWAVIQEVDAWTLVVGHCFLQTEFMPHTVWGSYPRGFLPSSAFLILPLPSSEEQSCGW